MSGYKDYGYQSAGWTGAHRYPFTHLRSMLDRSRGAILDLGCGNGSIARALILEGYDVYVFDASASGIAIANTEAPGHFFVLDVSTGQLPEEHAGNRFDAVISTEVIEHLYDTCSFIAPERKVLSDDGAFIASTPYHGYLKNLALTITASSMSI